MSTLSPSRESPLASWIRQRYQRWLSRRLPPARSITLEQRRLFIFPSRPGFLFMGALLLMLLTAINYQNNMSYALTFWLSMLFIVAVHYTHGNMMRMTIKAVRADAVFPGQRAEFVFAFSSASNRASHRSVRVVWPDSEVLIDVPPGESVSVSLFHPVGGRGWFRPPRLMLESNYPLGLLRCWSFAELDLQALVYPKPLPVASPPRAEDDEGSANSSDQTGSDDLVGFRDYRQGDSLKHVDWRAYAREQDLTTRLYAEPAAEEHWLDWHRFDSGTVEQRLSWLCWLALQYHGRNEAFGLRLPDQEIPMALGDRHLEVVLRALALYGEPTSSGGVT